MLGRDGQEGSSAATSERRPLAAPRAPRRAGRPGRGRHALTLGELQVTGAPVLLGDPRRRLAVPAIVLSAGWLTTAAFRALVV